MATEVQIPGSQATAKIRGPIAIILLMFVTLGIYGIFWYYYVNREMRDFGAARGDQELAESNPGNSVLAVTLGIFILVPPFISIYHTGQRLQRTQQLAGYEPHNGWLSLILFLVFAPAMYAYWQSELNKVWESAGNAPALTGGQAEPQASAPVPSEEAQGEASPPPPPPQS